MRKGTQENGTRKQAGSAVWLSDKINFQQRLVRRNKGSFHTHERKIY